MQTRSLSTKSSERQKLRFAKDRGGSSVEFAMGLPAMLALFAAALGVFVFCVRGIVTSFAAERAASLAEVGDSFRARAGGPTVTGKAEISQYVDDEQSCASACGHLPQPIGQLFGNIRICRSRAFVKSVQQTLGADVVRKGDSPLCERGGLDCEM